MVSVGSGIAVGLAGAVTACTEPTGMSLKTRISLDQDGRLVWTCMYGGVGAGGREASGYPMLSGMLPFEFRSPRQ